MESLLGETDLWAHNLRCPHGATAELTAHRDIHVRVLSVNGGYQGLHCSTKIISFKNIQLPSIFETDTFQIVLDSFDKDRLECSLHNSMPNNYKLYFCEQRTSLALQGPLMHVCILFPQLAPYFYNSRS